KHSESNKRPKSNKKGKKTITSHFYIQLLFKTKLGAQIKAVYKNEKLWFFSLFYFITFGSFVAFTVFLPSFLVDFFALDKVDAGFRTAGFIVIATLVRP